MSYPQHSHSGPSFRSISASRRAQLGPCAPSVMGGIPRSMDSRQYANPSHARRTLCAGVRVPQRVQIRLLLVLFMLSTCDSPVHHSLGRVVGRSSPLLSEKPRRVWPGWASS